ncbi:hypothetical protein [Polyangium aurulentum]|uniref:hypothetical protein n=1 Tax=Polyangium aurulentum TaxID=2567896 RepID=UPI0010AEB0F4|nr:hypothetical protein [Polyangium aurulentum]UQA61921.1 hypothetical protein E8A73_016195 [Polyangium aurulentum]
MYSGAHSSRFGQVACAAVLAGAVFAACSTTDGQTQFTSGGEGGSGANGSGSNGPGGPGSGGEGGSLFPSGPGATGVGGGSCAATSNKAEQVPLDMYVMFDRSGSMTADTGNGTRWQAVTGAFKSFIEQPSAAGIGVGVQYFPLANSAAGMCPAKCTSNEDCNPCAGYCFPNLNICIAGSGNDSCVAADYAKPDVEIAPLPGVAPAIAQSLANHTPTGGTPTYAALDGTIQHAKEWALAHPNHVVIAVLATDGDPSSCEINASAIHALAAAGANGVPKILTYVIGVGSEFAALNGIAQAGGTGQAFLVGSNQNASEQFLQAMNEIRGAALACSYLIPQPPPGEKIDYNAINVQYTPDGGMPQIIPQVKSKADCPPDGLAWFYDEPVKPKQIILCDATCGKISQDAKAKLDVLVGCATVVK